MKETNGMRNQLKLIRTRLGLSQQDLATAAGVARQTIGGIEAELYAPSAMVALRLAKALGCKVEEIFWLVDEETVVAAAPVSGMQRDTPLRLSLARIGEHWVAYPLQGDAAFRNEMVPADGVGILRSGADTVSVSLLDDKETLGRSAVLAGCSPALSLWARSAERWYPGLRVQWRHANSTQSLTSLAHGEVHAAGIHLWDPGVEEANVMHVRRILPGREVALVNLGVWVEGIAVQNGNPKSISGAGDLARDEVVLVNREEGAGSRIMLDSLLQAAGVGHTEVRGYDNLGGSHQEVALAIARGTADAGLTTESVAITFGLGFVPVNRVRYDLAVPVEYLTHEPVRQLLSTLQHRWVRSQLATLCGYDTSMTGDITQVSALARL